MLLLQPETMSDPSVEPLHTAELVVIDYTTLTEPFASSVNLSEQIAKAFGSEGVGIIGVRNVPGFQNAKKHLLSLAYPLAHLPPVELQKLEDPESLYNAGGSTIVVSQAMATTLDVAPLLTTIVLYCSPHFHQVGLMGKKS